MGEWIGGDVCRGQRSRGWWLVVTRTGDNWSITSLRYTALGVINRVRLTARRRHAAGLQRGRDPGSKFTARGREGRDVDAATEVKVNVSCCDVGDSCDTGGQRCNICWRIPMTVKAIATNNLPRTRRAQLLGYTIAVTFLSCKVR